MEKIKTRLWDSSEHLKTEEDVAEYFEACLLEGGDDPAFIAQALGVIARARGMTQVARDAGLTREGLYKALSSEGNPSFGTILKVIKALELQLHASTSRTIFEPLWLGDPRVSAQDDRGKAKAAVMEK